MVPDSTPELILYMNERARGSTNRDNRIGCSTGRQRRAVDLVACRLSYYDAILNRWR